MLRTTLFWPHVWLAMARLVILLFFQDKLLNSMTKEAPELAESCETSCVTCMERRAVMMVYPCNHTALCRLCFVKMIKHVTQLSIIVIIINFLILITSKSVYFHRYSFFLFPSIETGVWSRNMLRGLIIRWNELRFSDSRLYLSQTSSHWHHLRPRQLLYYDLLTPRTVLIRFTSFINNHLKAVSSRQLPLCCVVCNTKIQRVKNNKGTRHYSDNLQYKVPPGRSVNLGHPSALKIFLEIVSNGLFTQNNKSSPPPSSRRSLPPSVSGYSLSKSISNYSIKSGKFLQWNVTHLITN